MRPTVIAVAKKATAQTSTAIGRLRVGSRSSSSFMPLTLPAGGEGGSPFAERELKVS